MNNSRRQLLFGTLMGVGSLTLIRTSTAKSAPPPKERIIKIQAKKFAYSPNRITLKKGEAVVLEFTALDFMHGFNVPDWKLRADLMPGQATRVPVKPDSAGEFDFLCDNFCGTGHEEMNGKFIVTD